MDTTRSLAYVYNGGTEDAVYGEVPPAVGYDFLTGAASHTYLIGGGPPGTGDPSTGQEYYNFLRGTWGNGTPITAYGLGYQTPGEVTTWAFPGDPESEEFWSEVNLDGEGTDNPVGDRRQIISTPSFTIPPGGSHTVDFAILFAAGANHLNSVTALKAVSDEVQARYDAGGLFVPFPPFDPEPLAAPTLTAPAEGTLFNDVPVTFSWEPVDGATRYRLEVTHAFSDGTPDFAEAQVFFVFGGQTEITPDLDFPPYQIVDSAWRVQASGGAAEGPFSAVRSFLVFRTAPRSFAQGYGIVEAASPDGDVCPPGSDDDFGCRYFDGNRVWLDPNATSDYVVTTPNNALYEIARYDGAVGEDDFEMRFTDACATPGACLASLLRRRSRLRRRRDRERALRAMERRERQRRRRGPHDPHSPRDRQHRRARGLGGRLPLYAGRRRRGRHPPARRDAPCALDDARPPERLRLVRSGSERLRRAGRNV